MEGPIGSARLADLLGTLSLSTDLAAGVPMETSLRTCAFAARIARALGLGDAEVADAYYTALLRHLGCTGFAHEAAHNAAGDDHDFLRSFEEVDPIDRVAIVQQTMRSLARNKGGAARAQAIGRTLTTPSLATSLAAAQCEQASTLAGDLGMSTGVTRGLDQIFERYDGKGAPRGIDGDRIALSARILHVSTLVEIHHRHGGRDRARDVVRARRGRQLDPRVADAFFGEADALWPLLTNQSAWEAFLDAEPGTPRVVSAGDRDALALAFARYGDLKIPTKLGHSPAVADLACQAASHDGLPASEIETLRVAALLHDIGVVGVPNGVWEKRERFNVVDWERARRHSYDTERILLRAPALREAASIAGAHHERVDGSGYPRGTAVPAVSPAASRAARILAVADAFVGMTSARPHRPAMTVSEAKDTLHRETLAGHFCARATDAVLAAKGERLPRPSSKPLPHDLTAREIDVLVQVARGSTNKEIAAALGIAPRTAKHHLENVYAKVGVSTRSGAALFAVRNGMIPD